MMPKSFSDDTLESTLYTFQLLQEIMKFEKLKN
jgi:hypothetical protein